MKKIYKILTLAFLIGVVSSCSEHDGIDLDTSFISSVSSGNLSAVVNISTDNSGIVKVTPLGNGYTKATINFGHGTGAATTVEVAPGNSASYIYPEGNYTITVETKDITGKSTSSTYPVVMKYKTPENIVPTISGAANGLAVKATALYASSFLVYWGDVANEVGTPLAKNTTVTHVYNAPGDYDVKVVALSGNDKYSGAAKAEVITKKTIGPFSFAMPITFEDPAVNYFFGPFGGGQAFAKVDNPNPSGLNTSAKVGKFTRGSESWSGTYSPLNYLVDLSTNKKVKILVYNPDPALVGLKLNLELEAALGGTPANGVGVLKVPFTKSEAWEELVFDFSTISALPNNAKFGQIVFRFNDTVSGAVVGGRGSVFYIDNIRLTN